VKTSILSVMELEQGETQMWEASMCQAEVSKTSGSLSVPIAQGECGKILYSDSVASRSVSLWNALRS